MARHREIWRMTLGGWPVLFKTGEKSRKATPLDVYSTDEILLIKGVVTYPESREGREVRIEFHREGNGIDTAHRLIDVLQEWIRKSDDEL